jgi:3'(2'), 5'-bisphosphate nucleotidase
VFHLSNYNSILTPFSNHPLYDEFRIAIDAAIDASAILVKIYQTPFSKEYKADGSPVTMADKASSAFLIEALQKTNIPIVDEEAEEIPYYIRKNWKLSWCVDPLDGTKEFISKNDEFSINIALIENQKPIFGLIANPVKEEMLIGGVNLGVSCFAFKEAQKTDNWTKIEAKSELIKELVLATSRSHSSPETTEFVNQIATKIPDLKFFKMGSALKFFGLAKNEIHVYPRFAPTMEWDTAAGQIIAEEAGKKVLTLETFEPLIYNKPNLLNPYFIVF